MGWLVVQGRRFQVALAAHHPNLFRHFMAERLAPELFYCWWVQSLFHNCCGGTELVKLWDMFLFERSHKLFVRSAVALLGLLEPKLQGKDVEYMVKFLFDTQAWQLEPGALVAAALRTKITRTMLRNICG